MSWRVEEEGLLSLYEEPKRSWRLWNLFNSWRFNSSQAFWYDRRLCLLHPSVSEAPQAAMHNSWGFNIEIGHLFHCQRKITECCGPQLWIMKMFPCETERIKSKLCFYCNEETLFVLCARCLVSIFWSNLSSAHLDTLAQMCADAQSHTGSLLSVRMHI